MSQLETRRVQVFAISAADKGSSIDEVPSVEVWVRGETSVEEVLRSAISELSARENLPLYLLSTYPRAITRAIAQDVSHFDPAAPARVYSITPDGALCYQHDLELVPWDDFERALAADPAVSRKDAVAISRDGGTGGGELLFLGTAAIGALAATPAGASLWKHLTGLRTRRIRRITRRWMDRGIDHPQVIDNWFSKRDRWGLERVAELLWLKPGEAKWVLTNLGYEPLDGGLWVRSHSAEAQGRRRKWDLSTDRN